MRIYVSSTREPVMFELSWVLRRPPRVRCPLSGSEARHRLLEGDRVANQEAPGGARAQRGQMGGWAARSLWSLVQSRGARLQVGGGVPAVCWGPRPDL